MTELARTLVASAAAASPRRILDALTPAQAHHPVPGAPHTIYEELWHLAFWQQISLDWIGGVETPCPAHASLGFPTSAQRDAEPWDALRQRFLASAADAARAADDSTLLDQPVRCPSPPGHPPRTMTTREQLENLAAHNAYHLGRIVLLRQLAGAWPPPSGGFSW